MDRFKKWANQEFDRKERMMAVICGGFIFWVVIPFFIVILSSYFGKWLGLPKFLLGIINPLIGLLLLVTGWLFPNWTVKVQFSLGRGTPLPLMPTKRLIVKQPNTYCRNPMTLGTTAFYLGVAILMGSFSAPFPSF